MPSSKNSYSLSRFFSVSVCLPPFLLIDYAKITFFVVSCVLTNEKFSTSSAY